MKIVGITRVRNEEEILQGTLDHVSNFVDGVYAYDDCSTDSTVQILENHPIIRGVIKGKKWGLDPEDRDIAEGSLRTQVLKEARKDNPDWIYYFDADEFAYFDDIDFSADAYKLRLFDYYITPEDKNLSYRERKWMGPEYRDILMLFRNHPEIYFKHREPEIPNSFKVENKGFVKHYGKAISVEEWEKTCDYYIHHRGGSYNPFFASKWKNRKGKAVHKKSDFGRDFITWEDRHTKGVKLADRPSLIAKIRKKLHLYKNI